MDTTLDRIYEKLSNDTNFIKNLYTSNLEVLLLLFSGWTIHDLMIILTITLVYAVLLTIICFQTITIIPIIINKYRITFGSCKKFFKDLPEVSKLFNEQEKIILSNFFIHSCKSFECKHHNCRFDTYNNTCKFSQTEQYTALKRLFLHVCRHGNYPSLTIKQIIDKIYLLEDHKNKFNVMFYKDNSNLTSLDYLIARKDLMNVHYLLEKCYTLDNHWDLYRDFKFDSTIQNQLLDIFRIIIKKYFNEINKQKRKIKHSNKAKCSSFLSNITLLFVKKLSHIMENNFECNEDAQDINNAIIHEFTLILSKLIKRKEYGIISKLLTIMFGDNTIKFNNVILSPDNHLLKLIKYSDDFLNFIEDIIHNTNDVIATKLFFDALTNSLSKSALFATCDCFAFKGKIEYLEIVINKLKEKNEFEFANTDNVHSILAHAVSGNQKQTFQYLLSVSSINQCLIRDRYHLRNVIAFCYSQYKIDFLEILIKHNNQIICILWDYLSQNSLRNKCEYVNIRDFIFSATKNVILGKEITKLVKNEILLHVGNFYYNILVDTSTYQELNVNFRNRVESHVGSYKQTNKLTDFNEFFNSWIAVVIERREVNKLDKCLPSIDFVINKFNRGPGTFRYVLSQYADQILEDKKLFLPLFDEKLYIPYYETKDLTPELLHQYFNFGFYLAFCLIYNPSSLPLSNIIIKFLCNEVITLEDFLPNFLLKQLKQMKNWSEQEFEKSDLTMIISCLNSNGNYYDYDLVENGSLISIDTCNFNSYCEKIIDFYVNKGERFRVLSQISEGFYTLINDGKDVFENINTLSSSILLQPLIIQELEETREDSKQWELNVKINNGCKKSKKMFYDIIDQLTDKEYFELIKFITGNTSVPVGGLASLAKKGTPINITMIKNTGYPTACTCNNTMYLPEYESKDLMIERIREAIKCDSLDFV